MSKKFDKYRDVYPTWLHTPTCYILSMYDRGSNNRERYTEYKEEPKIPTTEDVEQYKEKYDLDDWGAVNKFMDEHILKVPVIKHKDKEFCIIEFYGKKGMLCGWRNVDTCKMGMPFFVKYAKKNGINGFYYKNQFIKFPKYGWVF